MYLRILLKVCCIHKLIYITKFTVTEAGSTVLDPCDNTTEDAMAAPTSVKVTIIFLILIVHNVYSIFVYPPRNGADVITVVSRECEKIVKALAGGNMKSICRAFFANPHLKQEAVSKVYRMVSPCCANRMHSQCHCSAICPSSRLRTFHGLGLFLR